MSETPALGQIGVPWMRVHSEAYDIPPEIAHEIASIVIQWSQFESGIALDTSTYMSIPNIRALTKDEPRNFKGKIELWKRSVHTLFPSVELYKSKATEICSKGKILARHRHRLIHANWQPSPQGKPGEFHLYTDRGLDTVEYFEEFLVNLEYLKAVHQDIGTISDALYEFMANRTWHGSLGLLQAHAEP